MAEKARTRVLYEIVPQKRRWLIRMAGDSVSELCDSKGKAIARARQLARRHDEWRVRVLTKSGSVESESRSTPKEAP
jgi:hypothetical protein